MIQSVIATRSFFGVRWLKNITDNFLFAENINNFEFYNEDSFFAASGCSLKTFLKTGKNMLNKKFISAAASAVPALSAYGINPDLCISTDGGFWAASHIKAAFFKNSRCIPARSENPLQYFGKEPLRIFNLRLSDRSLLFYGP
ncbi:6-hydroxymethylpterin diphosphokinase MptE-like protein [Treponema pedis]|uniref:6-hydroxymethylpterin diphosphokinase MptE-like protein n=1 Tax=Treponema pedis TaxID=409322 RepID=UPI00208FFD13|nr:6-hydroxymethylpterin diphosphokinase MptE-like protein [Treponema pedis]